MPCRTCTAADPRRLPLAARYPDKVHRRVGGEALVLSSQAVRPPNSSPEPVPSAGRAHIARSGTACSSKFAAHTAFA